MVIEEIARAMRMGFTSERPLHSGSGLGGQEGAAESGSTGHALGMPPGRA